MRVIAKVARRAAALALGVVLAFALLEGALQIAALVFACDSRAVAPSAFVDARRARDATRGEATHGEATRDEVARELGARADAASAARTILCLGDSHTYGSGVKSGESWPARLGERLADAAGGAWQVVNAGVPGRNSAEVAAELEADLDAYTPRIAIVWIGCNDSWSLAHAEQWSDERPSAWPRVLAHSRALRALRIAWLRVGEDVATDTATDTAKDAATSAAIDAELDTAIDPDDVQRAIGARALRSVAQTPRRATPLALDEQRRCTARALARIEAQCTARGVHTLYVTYAADTESVRGGANVALREHATAARAPLLDLEPELLPLAARHGYAAVFAHDWHPNALACAEIARRVHETLRERGWVEPRDAARDAPSDATAEAAAGTSASPRGARDTTPLAERLERFDARELARDAGRLVLGIRGRAGARWRPRLAALFEPDPAWDARGAAPDAAAQWERRLRRAKAGLGAPRVAVCSALLDAGALGEASAGGTLADARELEIELQLPSAQSAAALPREPGELFQGWRISIQFLDVSTQPPAVYESRRFDA